MMCFFIEAANLAGSIVIYNRYHFFRVHDVPDTLNASSPVFILTLQDSVVAPFKRMGKRRLRESKLFTERRKDQKWS